MSTSFIKRQIRRFHVVVMQWASKKYTKKRDARAELLLIIKFSIFGGCRRRSCLSSLMTSEERPQKFHTDDVSLPQSG